MAQRKITKQKTRDSFFGLIECLELAVMYLCSFVENIDFKTRFSTWDGIEATLIKLSPIRGFQIKTT